MERAFGLLYRRGYERESFPHSPLAKSGGGGVGRSPGCGRGVNAALRYAPVTPALYAPVLTVLEAHWQNNRAWSLQKVSTKSIRMPFTRYPSALRTRSQLLNGLHVPAVIKRAKEQGRPHRHPRSPQPDLEASCPLPQLVGDSHTTDWMPRRAIVCTPLHRRHDAPTAVHRRTVARFKLPVDSGDAIINFARWQGGINRWLW